MSASDVRRGLLSVAAALALVVPLSTVVPATANAATDATVTTRTTSFVVLKRGDEGLRVRRVQRWLLIARTGNFGSNTEQAVQTFQKDRGLAVTGEVDQRVWNALSDRWQKIDDRYQRVLTIARNQFGDPYSYGAAGPNAFDCSGYTMYVYEKATGLTMPHLAGSQYKLSTRITRAEAHPGDLVFFHSGSTVYHAAIYAGHGYVYHAAQPGTVVGRERIWTSKVWFGRVIRKA